MTPAERRVGTTRRRVAALLALALLVSSTVGVLYEYGTQPASQQPGIQVQGNGQPVPDITTTLNLTVTRHGALVGQRIIHDDLILDNFNQILKALFTNWPGGGTVTASVTSVANAGLSINVKSSTTFAVGCGQSGTFFMSVCAEPAADGGQIYIGTGTQASSRTLHALNAAYGNPINVISTSCQNNSPPQVIAQGSINAGSGGSITEAGFADKMQAASNPDVPILFTYETFSGVTVNTGDFISVSYTFTLNNNGANRNLCNFLATFFLATNTQTTWTAFDTSNNGYQMCGWNLATNGCNNSVGYSWMAFQTGVTVASGPNAGLTQSADGTCTNDMGIWPGTGAPTYSFTSVALGGPVGSSPITVSGTTYASGLQNSYVFVTENTWNPGSNTATTELGMFICRQVNTGGGLGNARFLLYGQTFSVVTATSGQTNPLSVQISD